MMQKSGRYKLVARMCLLCLTPMDKAGPSLRTLLEFGDCHLHLLDQRQLWRRKASEMISHNLARELGEMPNPPENITRSWFNYFQFDPTKDSPSEIRNVLLIVVTLIAAVTFQAGVNPPGGVWQDTGNGHKAGRAIYASQQPAYDIFMLSNTLAFSSSILVIISLTYNFPFRVEIWVATMSMVVTYASAILAVTPHESLRNRYIWAVAAVPIIIRCFIQFVYNYVIDCLSINASDLAEQIRKFFFHTN